MRLPKHPTSLTATFLTLTIGLWLGGLPLLVLAQEYIPPDRGLPGRREGGGTRGAACIQSQPSLIALMPNTNYGETVEAYPTWFWYVPQTLANSAEFVLLDRNNNEVYATTFQIANNPGIISLSLPDTTNLPPLTVGQDYHWYFSLICNAQDRSADVFVEGWTQRVELDPALAQQLEISTSLDRTNLYAQAGLWHDALKTVVDLRRFADPRVSESGAYEQQWYVLLESIGLENLADQPLVQCCEQPAVPTPTPSPSIVP